MNKIKPTPHVAVPPDHPLRTETAKLRQTLVFMERLAIIAINRLGGTMRVKDGEWAQAQNADIQWRTMRMQELEPELHVAVTLVGESVSVNEQTIKDLKNAN